MSTAEKWSRLYGGAIVVALVNDGRGLDEPLDWDQVTSVEELIPFERPLIQPDTVEYRYFDDLNRKDRERRFGDPAFYDVYSQNGSFRVHYSRCLVFRNGRLPESANSAIYRHWGVPVYMKVREALREAISSHHDGTKLLERSVLGVYKMKNLSQLLATDEGENKVIQRLQVIDMARNIINSMAIDNDGEDYQYINASMSGASDIIDRTCNMLSAVTDIPQTILFGKDPAGEDATGDNDRDNYFQLLNRIQTNSYHDAAVKVVKLVLKEIVAEGEDEGDIPEYEVRFNPMKQLSEEEQANIDSIKAGTAQTKAATAQVYVDMQALDPSEVRKCLADSNDYQIQGIVENDNLEIPDEAYDLRKQFAELSQIGGEGEGDGNAAEDQQVPQGADNSSEDGMMNADGGPGSGNWSHSGRPGLRGGSGSGGGAQYRTVDRGAYSSAAKVRQEEHRQYKALKQSLSNRMTIGEMRDTVAKVHEDILKNNGVVTPEHVKEAGTAVHAYVMSQYSDEVTAVVETYEKMNSKEMSKAMQAVKEYDVEKSKQAKVKRGLATPEEAGFASEQDYLEADGKLKQKGEQVENLRMRIKEARTEYENAVGELNLASGLKSEEITTDALKTIRDVGPADDLDHILSGKKEYVEKAKDVYDHLPTSWNPTYEDDADIHSIGDVGPGGRANYSSITGRISVAPESHANVYYHEYGHKIEDKVDGVHDVIMDFYNRRTAGEKSAQLVGYCKGEVTKKDSFVDPYIGKVYSNGTEVLSMGLQYAYTDNVTMMRDTDMSQLIYGILAVM